MVAQVSQNFEETFSETVDIYTLLGEPGDPKAFWGELKVVQLQGFDYIYFSSKINTKLAGKTALQAFLIDVFQLADTRAERAKIFIYVENTIGKPDFFEFRISWAGNKIKEFNIENIDNPKNKEFIRTMYDYSSGILETVGHG
ncbi:hypothetical protein TDB9533_00997 [Thalassocella blandensis]|nr:hypothetical protein TDB9533_00997 [Thalassocella blandensis]